MTRRINSEITKSSVPQNSTQSNVQSIRGGDTLNCVLTGLIILSFDMITPSSASIFHLTSWIMISTTHTLSSLSVIQTEGVVMGG